jgi:hypothetical protein
MQVDSPSAVKQASDTLGVRELPSMAAVVTAIAQPFAQLGEHFHLPFLPLVVAALAALLLAARSTWPAEGKAWPLDAWVGIPLIALALFASSLGANNIITRWLGPADSASAQAVSAELDKTSRQLKLANEQLAVKQQQIDLQDKAIAALKQAAGIASAKDMLGAPQRVSASAGAGILSGLLDLLASSAVAQTDAPRARTAPDKRKIEDELKALELKRQQLEQQCNRLAEEQRKLESAPTPSADKSNKQLWRAW